MCLLSDSSIRWEGREDAACWLPVHCSGGNGKLRAWEVPAGRSVCEHMVVVSSMENPASFPGKGGGKGCSVWVSVQVTLGLCPSRKIRASHLAFWGWLGIAAAGFALQHHRRSGIFHWVAEMPFPASVPRCAASPEMLSACASVNQCCPKALGSADWCLTAGVLWRLTVVLLFPLAPGLRGKCP